MNLFIKVIGNKIVAFIELDMKDVALSIVLTIAFLIIV